MRPRKQRTRRQKALRWIAVLAVLLAYIFLPGKYHFRPASALGEAEEMGKLGPTYFIAQLPGEEGRILRGSEKGMMALTLYNAGVYGGGWQTKDWTYLDCSGSEPLYAGFDAVGLTAYDNTQLYDWFGCIHSPEAAAVRLEIYRKDRLEDTYTLLDTRTVPREEWIGLEGRTYFAVSFWREAVYDGMARSELLDEAGNVLCSRELRMHEVYLYHSFDGLFQ